MVLRAERSAPSRTWLLPPGVSCTPSLAVLAAMNAGELRAVAGFRVERAGWGAITFDVDGARTTDLSSGMPQCISAVPALGASRTSPCSRNVGFKCVWTA